MRMHRFVAATLFFATLTAPLAAPAAVRYVNVSAGGANDGTSWTDAYTSLDTALTAATGGDDLWVAQGTYIAPTAGFALKSSVNVYGGFASGDNFAARNWATKVTILSGDVNQDDAPNWANRTDNRARVVLASSISNARLDGFTVTKGYQTVTGNGCGMLVSASTALDIYNCVFSDNWLNSASFYGAGIGLTGLTTANIVNCVVSGNRSGYRGCGIGFDTVNNASALLNIMNCTVVTNNGPAGVEGGGIYILRTAGSPAISCYVRNSIVWRNTGSSDIRGRNYANVAVSNTYFGTFSNIRSDGGNFTNNVSDPGFADVANGDFHLTAGSVCRDTGSTLFGAPTTDYDGQTRDATPDIGADEYVAGGDVTPPAEVTGLSVTPGHQFLTLAWTNPGDGDFAGVLVVRKQGSAPTGTPSGGASYTIGQALGDGTVVSTNNGTGLTDSGLLLGTNYYYTLHTYDALKNYSTGVQTNGIPVADSTAPDAVTGFTATTLSDSQITLDWTNSASGDSLGVLVLRRTGGVPTGTPVHSNAYTAGTTIGDGTVVYVGTGSSATPSAASTWTDTTLTQENTLYGYSIFARDVVPNYSARADASDTTLTDNTAPGNVTAPSATADDAEVLLSWTNPSDQDVAGVLILRSTSGTPTGTPANGTTYTEGQTIGGDDVVYVGGSTTPGGIGAWADQGLVNGTTYYYKIFARDEHPNYASGGANASATPAAPASVKYVDPAAAGAETGSSWANAFRTLTNALANAVTGDELWVAAGTHKPGTLTTDRFTLKHGVELYGGFTNGMSHRYERDWSSHPTILSGDLAGNDTANFGNRSDNSTNVVWADGGIGNIELNGFTVKGGCGQNIGAGIYIGLATVVVQNCTIQDNWMTSAANWGAGVGAIQGAHGTLVNCLITGNKSSFRGGGVGLDGFASPYCWIGMVNCTIVTNEAASEGAGIYARANTVSLTAITNCIVSGNFGLATTDLRARNGVIFAAHSAYGTTSGTISNNSGNLAEGTDPQLVNAAGGNFHLSAASPCIDTGTGSGAPTMDLDQNLRPLDAGFDMGAYEFAGEDASPPDPVTGLSLAPQSDTQIQLSWTNSASSDAEGVLIVRRTGALPTGSPVDTTVHTAGDTLGDGTVVYVGTGSSGTPGAASTWTDTTLPNALTLYGYSVFARDEVPNYATRADGSATTLGDFTAPGNVTGATATGDDGEILLEWNNPSDADAAGVLILRSTVGTPTGVPSTGVTYTAGQTIGGDLVVYVGGSAGAGAAGMLSQQGLVNGTTYYYAIIARDEVPNYASGSAVNATPTAPASVKYVDANATGAGTGASWADAYPALSNALTDATSGDELWVAQGTYKPGTLTTSRFTLKSNVALYGGFTNGMTHRYERDWTAHATTLSGDVSGNDAPNWANRADNCANVVWADGSLTGVVLDGFTVSGGYGAAAGAGLYVGSAAFTVANCVFTDNRVTAASIHGGGMGAGVGANGTVENCLFFANQADFGGGFGIDGFTGFTLVTLANCTVSSNTAASRGSGIYARADTTPILALVNTIVWGNVTAADLQEQGNTTIGVEHSAYGVLSGSIADNGGNLAANTNPEFVDATSFDFQLAATSPAIDAGTANSAPLRDFTGNVRPYGTAVDMGAYEWFPEFAVTLATAPAGLQVAADGDTQTAPHAYSLTAADHTISVDSPQAGGTGTQFVWSAWSDAGAQSHTITVAAPVTYTATFSTQVLLTVVADTGGFVGGDSGWLNLGDNASISAIADIGYDFAGWTGAISSTNNPESVPMNGAKWITATFVTTTSTSSTSSTSSSTTSSTSTSAAPGLPPTTVIKWL